MSMNSKNGAKEHVGGGSPLAQAESSQTPTPHGCQLQVVDEYKRWPLSGICDKTEAILIFPGEDGTFLVGSGSSTWRAAEAKERARNIR
jgi:hypothetical protein